MNMNMQNMSFTFDKYALFQTQYSDLLRHDFEVANGILLCNPYSSQTRKVEDIPNESCDVAWNVSHYVYKDQSLNAEVQSPLGIAKGRLQITDGENNWEIHFHDVSLAID